jgi:small-conductance mechanosensitive channel
MPEPLSRYETIMETMQRWLTKALALVTESELLGAGIILILALIAAKLVDFFLERVVLSFARKTSFHLDDAVIKILNKPIRVSILLLGALVGVRWIAPHPPFAFILVAVIQTLLVILWALAFNALFRRIAGDWIEHWRRAGRQGTEMISLVGNILRVILLAAAVFLFLSIWRIDVTPLLASAGIAGIAVALAAKETLSNFFGGVSVFLDQPFRTGDYIILDSGERGEVVDIGLRSTRILTRDDVQISIPNAIIANTKVINESAPEPRFRVRLKLGVAYGTDVDELEEILLSAARNNPLVAPAPEPRVRFRAFGDSALEFELLCWAHRPHDKGKLVHELNKTIYTLLDHANITIPFPQRDVHVTYPWGKPTEE